MGLLSRNPESPLCASLSFLSRLLSIPLMPLQRQAGIPASYLSKFGKTYLLRISAMPSFMTLWWQKIKNFWSASKRPSTYDCTTLTWISTNHGLCMIHHETPATLWCALATSFILKEQVVTFLFQLLRPQKRWTLSICISSDHPLIMLRLSDTVLCILRLWPGAKPCCDLELTASPLRNTQMSKYMNLFLFWNKLPSWQLFSDLPLRLL